MARLLPWSDHAMGRKLGAGRYTLMTVIEPNCCNSG
jgi:hypothetical protein